MLQDVEGGLRSSTGSLGPSLQVDEQQSINRTGIEPISPENKLQMFLRYMSGGSCHDIIAYSGTAFYDCIHQVMDALLDHPELRIKFPEEDAEQLRVMRGFKAHSNGSVMRGCVGAIDGWLCQIDVSRKTEVPKACCDYLSRFTSVAITSPGGTGDSAAFGEWGLASIVAKLPIGRFLVGDNAYANGNRLLTPFARPSITDDYRDSFNYHLSQLRIRIEMSFGLLVRKWRVFRSPLQVKFDNVSRVIMAGCILHSWCINQRLAEDPEYSPENDEVLVEGIAEIERVDNRRAKTRRTTDQRTANPRTENEHDDNSAYRRLYMSPDLETRQREIVDGDKNLVRNAIVNLLRRNNRKRPQRNINRRARMDAQQ